MLILLGCETSLTAQTNSDYNKVIKIETGRPFSIANKAFNRYYKGLYTINSNIDFLFKNNIVIGAFIGVSAFEDTKEDRTYVPLRPELTKFNNITGSFELGYEKKIAKKSYFAITGNIGYSMASFQQFFLENDSLIASQNENAISWGVAAKYGWLIEGKGAIGFFVRFRTNHFVYKPQLFEGQEIQENNFPTMYWSTGLLFSFGI